VNKITTAVVSVLAGFVLSANAGMIIGGSTLLTSTSLDMLEAHLGQGDIDVTNIFTKTAGSTSFDFHAAADGMGATFTIMEITDVTDKTKKAIVGGYNPKSWSSNFGWVMTQSNTERTAFIFNLTTGLFQDQKLNTSDGSYQTKNNSALGPTFGGGNDIYVNSNLAGTGYAYSYSYGDAANINITGFGTSRMTYYNINALEVFTIAPASVPEPSSISLMVLGLLSFAGAGFFRRKK
jgi:hypothetical protein